MQKPYPLHNYAGYRPSKNIYAAKYIELVTKSAPTAFTCHETESRRGRWREFFGIHPEQKINLEIGCYHGESIVAMAAQNPDEVFIGIEWKFREAYKAVEKAMKRGLKNVVILRANAARLPWMFAPGELDRVWIMFPDPWPKTTQQKWRVLHADFFRALALLLKPGNEVLLKTDDSDYALFIGQELREANAYSVLADERAQALWEKFPYTPFEKIFFRNNSPIFQFSLERNQNRVTVPTPVQEILGTSASI